MYKCETKTLFVPQNPHLEFRESHQVTKPTPTIRRTPVVVRTAAPAKNPWSLPVAETSLKNGVYDKEADPCVICHEEMAQKMVFDLECGHRFHADVSHHTVAWVNTLKYKEVYVSEHYPN